MNFSEIFTSKDTINLDKKTLVILRWLALGGQYLTISIVYFILNFDLAFFYCSAVIVLGALTNFYLQFGFKKNQLNNFTSTFFLFYDLIQLSVLLYLTGGITNPFSVLLIIPAITSSTFLTLRSTINLSIITILILIILTLYHFYLGRILSKFRINLNKHSHKFYRYINEIPTILLILIVFVVIFKPI